MLVSLFTTSCKEIMSNLDQPVSSYLELKKSSSILEPGQTCTIEASTISTSPITYKSLNPDKATVDAKGVVTAVDDGEATIVVQTAANENYVAGVAEFKVYVRTPDLFDPLTLEAKADGNINISFTNYVTIAPKLEEPIIYSINGGEEKSVTAYTSFAVKTGDKVQFKSKNKTLARRFKNGDYYFIQSVRILPQVQCAVYGNAMSMVSPDGNWHLNREIKEKFALGYLFYNATNLVNDETRNLTLPATTLTDSCYFYTFRNCYGLTRAPELPAKEIKNSSYRYMFQNCSSLTEVPDINVKTIGERGCYYMFYNCDALTTAPAITVETVGDYGCYYMFRNCDALTTAPAITAETVGVSGFRQMFDACYNLKKAGAVNVKNVGNSALRWMFQNCTALTEAPAVTAENVDDYGMASMFYGCNNMTKANAINVKNVKKVDEGYGLAWMFSNCTALEKAPTLSFETLGDYACYAMFYNCQSLEEAPALPATNLAPYCYAWMFERCTNLKKAPALPATELKNGCYNGMFSVCVSLAEAPELKAESLPAECYMYMFQDCYKLSKVTCMAKEMTGYNAISYMLAGAGTDASVTERTFTRSTSNNNWAYCDTWDWVWDINDWRIPSGWTFDPAITASSAPARRAAASVKGTPIKTPTLEMKSHMKGAEPTGGMKAPAKTNI